jgi:hypothetical protein
MKDRFYEEPEYVFDQFLKHRMRTLLGDFSAKISREDIFKPTVGNACLPKISNHNSPANLVVKSTIFPHCSICKFTQTSLGGNPHNQIDHV